MEAEGGCWKGDVKREKKAEDSGERGGDDDDDAAAARLEVVGSGGRIKARQRSDNTCVPFLFCCTPSFSTITHTGFNGSHTKAISLVSEPSGGGGSQRAGVHSPDGA